LKLLGIGQFTLPSKNHSKFASANVIN